MMKQDSGLLKKLPTQMIGMLQATYSEWEKRLLERISEKLLKMQNSLKTLPHKSPVLYAYVMTHDSGFAPHVGKEGGLLTLATCKPTIRRVASKGDFILGVGGVGLHKLSHVNTVNKMVYLAQVTDKLSYNDYFREEKYKQREDNIYHQVKGRWIQKKNELHDERAKDHDTRGKYVILSHNFLYLGRRCADTENILEDFTLLPEEIGRGHRVFSFEEYPEIESKIRSVFERFSSRINRYSEPCKTEYKSHKGCATDH